jgi:hypothetical protein
MITLTFQEGIVLLLMLQYLIKSSDPVAVDLIKYCGINNNTRSS